MRRLLTIITNKDEVSNEFRNKIQCAFGKHDDLLQTQMVRLCLESFWHDQDNSARVSKRNKKERKTMIEVKGRHKGLDRAGIWPICQCS